MKLSKIEIARQNKKPDIIADEVQKMEFIYRECESRCVGIASSL